MCVLGADTNDTGNMWRLKITPGRQNLNYERLVKLCGDYYRIRAEKCKGVGRIKRLRCHPASMPGGDADASYRAYEVWSLVVRVLAALVFG